MSQDAGQEAGVLSRRDFEQDIILRARVDPEFREALLTDPRAALYQAYEVEVPPDVELQVVEESHTKLYLVLPCESDELTDEELAGVAGGVGAPMSLRLTGTFATSAECIRR